MTEPQPFFTMYSKHFMSHMECLDFIKFRVSELSNTDLGNCVRFMEALKNALDETISLIKLKEE